MTQIEQLEGSSAALSDGWCFNKKRGQRVAALKRSIQGSFQVLPFEPSLCVALAQGPVPLAKRKLRPIRTQAQPWALMEAVCIDS